jgi:hypothetical protein
MYCKRRSLILLFLLFLFSRGVPQAVAKLTQSTPSSTALSLAQNGELSSSYKLRSLSCNQLFQSGLQILR